MPARVDSFPVSHHPAPAWRLLKPALGWAIVAAGVALFRRYAQQPALPRMSEQWLLSHQSEFNRDER